VNRIVAVLVAITITWLLTRGRTERARMRIQLIEHRLERHAARHS
jgi:hypothetical protein